MLASRTVANRAPNAHAAADSPDRLTHEQAVDRIMAINPTATPAFLAQFRVEELRSYLDHLLSLQRPRGREARWRRPEGTRAIVARARSA